MPPTDYDLDADNAGGSEPVETPEPSAGATPTFSMDQMRAAIQETVGTIMNRAAETYRAQNRPQPVEEPEPLGATEEDYATNTSLAVRKDLQRFEHGLMKRFNQVANMGLERLGSLTQSQMRATLPYYTKYEGEINAELNALRPELRTDPTSIRFIHDSVAMRHEAERLEEVRKEASRQARGDAPSPSGVSGRNRPAEPGIPTPEDLGYSADQIDDINQRGGLDAFARKISEGRFQGWAEYATSAQKRAAAPRKGRGSIINFKRGKAVGGALVADGDILTGPARKA